MIVGRFARRRGEDGFTLIETLAALLVFAIMTIGLVPLLISSLQGSDLSRSTTINKNAAVEAMERVRGLPYHVSFGSQNTKVDVLDLYFPKAGVESPAVAGQAYAVNQFTTTCNNANLSNPACPRNIPDGTTLTFVASFTNPGGGTPPPVPGTYAWNANGADIPPSQLLDMSITATWTQRGIQRSFRLQSLIGDRKFGGIKIRGEANVEFGIQVLASYSNAAGEISELLALAGASETVIESRSLSTSDVSVRGADVRLTKLPTATEPTAAELDSAVGAESTLHAPPDQPAPGGSSVTPQTVTHPELAMDVAGFDTTSTNQLKVTVTGERPEGSGRFSYSNGLGALDFWVHTQVDAANNDLRKLDTSQPVFTVRGKQINGTSSGSTGALGAADRDVETRAQLSINGMRILPTTFIVAENNSFNGALIRITNFTADTQCRSTDSATTAFANATWSADLQYWRDNVPDDDIADGDYSPVVSLNGGTGADPLANLKLTNPLVYDGPSPADDVYLFEDPANLRSGYLVDWSSLRNLAGSEDPSGRLTQAQIPGAIKIDTAPTNPLVAESGLNIQIGQLSCEALDDR